MDDSVITLILTMSGAQKFIVFGFLGISLGLVLLGIFATGIFRKKIEVVTLDEDKQLSAIQGYLEDRGISVTSSLQASEIDLGRGGRLYLEKKRGLPWVVYSSQPDSVRFSKTTRYTVMELPNRSGFKGFVGERRYVGTQNYKAYFAEEYGWDQIREWDQIFSIFGDNNSTEAVTHFVDQVRSCFKKSPTADPVLIVANSDTVKFYFPFWPASTEQFDYIVWNVQDIKPNLN